MAISKHNSLTRGMTGKFDDLVFRYVNGKHVVQRAPKFSSEPSAKQLIQRNAFKAAIDQAKVLLQNPVLKADYTAIAKWKKSTALKAAIGDCRKAIRVKDVYAFPDGGLVFIEVDDNYKVKEMEVAISVDGVVHQQGYASFQFGGSAWQFKLNAPILNVKLSLTMKDRPGNVVFYEQMVCTDLNCSTTDSNKTVQQAYVETCSIVKEQIDQYEWSALSLTDLPEVNYASHADIDEWDTTYNCVATEANQANDVAVLKTSTKLNPERDCTSSITEVAKSVVAVDDVFDDKCVVVIDHDKQIHRDFIKSDTCIAAVPADEYARHALIGRKIITTAKYKVGNSQFGKLKTEHTLNLGADQLLKKPRLYRGDLVIPFSLHESRHSRRAVREAG